MGKLIFSLDDSNVIKTNLEQILEKAGYDQVHAFDGKEGTEIAEKIIGQNKKISLVLCDYNMPYLNGIEFLKWFKAKAEFKFVPVIMFTTESEIALMQEAKKNGAAGWIIKPFEAVHLLDMIRKFAR